MHPDEANSAITAVSSGNAATLTYTVAPQPFRYQALFAILIAAPPGKQEKTGFLNFWRRTIGGGPEQRQIKKSQAAFARCFARQLEVRNSYIVVSVTCALLSHGQPYWGMLWATAYGLYFGGAAANGCCVSSLPQTGEAQQTMEVTEGNDKAWEYEGAAVREVLSFRDVVSLLPSIALTVEDGPPYVVGIPNPVVRPNALQVFTVSPNQIYQFVYLHALTVIPPSSLPATERNLGKVLLQHEYDTIRTLSSDFDAVTFCALTERLWEARLKTLQIPLCRDGVEYAESH
ncbi:hypothetical protein TRSC58_04850 [Trypanosoma rangeli SC58]|uniref:Uncharacterized protein n=1 Tax=Trypanosoma rangeli SC58 TaxID=429131 RepID=A0A061IZH1_TRYRA|nr:hypothetical protein TRSC58_04850 [Trypanosoma rangeli SC58]